MRLMTFSLLFACLTAVAQQPAPPPQGDVQHKFEFRVAPEIQRRAPLRLLPRQGAPGDSNLCYKLRVYQMARRPRSDETYPIRQRTCTPASAFRLKPPLLTPPEQTECQER